MKKSDDKGSSSSGKKNRPRPAGPELVDAGAPPVPPEFSSSGIHHHHHQQQHQHGQHPQSRNTVTTGLTGTTTSTVTSKSVLKDKKTRTRDKNEVVRPGAQAIHEPAEELPAISSMMDRVGAVSGAGCFSGPELIGQDSNNINNNNNNDNAGSPLPPQYAFDKANSQGSSGNENYLTRLARKRNKNKASNTSSFSSGKPTSSFTTTTTTTMATSAGHVVGPSGLAPGGAVLDAQVEPMDVPRPTEIEGEMMMNRPSSNLMMEGGGAAGGAGTAFSQTQLGSAGGPNVLERHTAAMDRMSMSHNIIMGAGEGDGHRHHRHHHQQQLQHHSRDDVENQYEQSSSPYANSNQQQQQQQSSYINHFNNSNDNNLPKSASRTSIQVITNPKVWTPLQMKFAMCSVLNVVLIIIIIALGASYASLNNKSDDCILIQSPSPGAEIGDGDNDGPNTVIPDGTDDTTALTPTSNVVVTPPTCLKTTFQQQLLPDDTLCGGEGSTNGGECPEIFIAVDGDNSIVTVGNVLYFFSYTTATAIPTVANGEDSMNNTTTTAADEADATTTQLITTANVDDGEYAWRNIQIIEMHSSNSYMPVAIFQDVIVVGAPTETKDTVSGAAYIFELDGANKSGSGEEGDDVIVAANGMDILWKEVQQLEKGWEDNDIEFESGILSLFGKTVDVRDGLIAIGAFAERGQVNPTFFFRRNRFEWIRESMNPNTSNRYQSVTKVAIGPNGLALSTLSDPPFEVQNDVVYLFQSKEEGSGSMTLFQKLEVDECVQLGDQAEFLDDGSFVISCIGDDYYGSMKYYIPTKISTNSGEKTVYELKQTVEFPNENNQVADSGVRWFAVDGNNGGIMLAREGTDTAHMYGRLGDAASTAPWEIYTDASLVGYDAIGSDLYDFYGDVALSGDTVFMATADNVRVYKSEEC